MAELEDIDRALADLHTGADRLGGLLLELELDGDRKLLDATTLKGATATRWSAVDLLGACGVARAADGDRSRARTSCADRCPPGCPRASAAAEPSSARWSTGPGRSSCARRCRPRKRRARSWPRPARRGERSRRGIDPPSMPGRLHGWASECEQLVADLAADPLSVDPARVDALEQAIEELAGLREAAATRLAAARALLDSLEAAQRDGEAAHELVLVKIANPSIPSPRRVLSELAAGLREIESLVEHARWTEARDALAGWSGDATAELERALAIAAANLAPIECATSCAAAWRPIGPRRARLRLLEDAASSRRCTRAPSACCTPRRRTSARRPISCGAIRWACPARTGRSAMTCEQPDCTGTVARRLLRRLRHGAPPLQAAAAPASAPAPSPAAAPHASASRHRSSRAPARRRRAAPARRTRAQPPRRRAWSRSPRALSRPAGRLIWQNPAVAESAALLRALRRARRARRATGRPGRTEGFCRKCGAPLLVHAQARGGRPSSAASTRSSAASPTAGMGWVYLARDHNVSDRWVVLKGLLNSGRRRRDGRRARRAALPCRGRAPEHRQDPQLRPARELGLHRHGVRRRARA